MYHPQFKEGADQLHSLLQVLNLRQCVHPHELLWSVITPTNLSRCGVVVHHAVLCWAVATVGMTGIFL
jgi:hypothetical protein